MPDELPEMTPDGKIRIRDPYVGEFGTGETVPAAWAEPNEDCGMCGGEGRVSDDGYWFGQPHDWPCPECQQPAVPGTCGGCEAVSGA